jgi:2-(1,2-epoxy-1,2-dihydrophenyl)acetyl-CoA isomerase
MGEVLVAETIGRLRVLRLNRPERKNALNGALFQAITAGVVDAARDDEVWALAVTGSGDAFCSGLDLDDVGPPDEPADGPADGPSDGPDEPGERDELVGNFALLLRVVCDKPVIAGVNGVAVGIGVSLAMAADLRLAAPSARFHPGYARVGTSPDGGGTWTVTQALGYEGAMRFFLEQRMIGAEEALRIGLVGEVAESDAGFDERFVEYAQQIATVAPLAARQTKQLLGKVSQPSDLRGHLADEVRLALHGLASEDSAEAIRAMVARDEPVFRGR